MQANFAYSSSCNCLLLLGAEYNGFLEGTFSFFHFMPLWKDTWMIVLFGPFVFPMYKLTTSLPPPSTIPFPSSHPHLKGRSVNSIYL